MDTFLQKTKSLNNNLVCPKCYSLIPIQESRIIDDIIDKKFRYYFNSLYSNISKFYKKIMTIINNIKSITTAMDNQSIHSKKQIDLIILKYNNYNERFQQLSDRIDLIIQSKKLLDDNLSLVNDNINIFMNSTNQIFKKIKTRSKQYIQEIYQKEFKNNNDYNDINLNSKMNFLDNNIYLSSDNKLNTNEKKLFYRNLNNIVNNIKLDEYNPKNNNTLIFPNNINQNIFNYTITSRDFKKMNKVQNIGFYNYNSIYKNKSQSNNKSMNELQTKENKMIRSSSIPDMSNKNIINERYSSINNDNGINISNNNVIKLCYKVKDFFDYLNDDSIEESKILLKKIEEIKVLINIILKNNKEIKHNKIFVNYNIRNSANNLSMKHKSSFVEKSINLNKTSIESLKNMKILTEKINDLNNKIKEKDEHIKYIKKYINNPINNKDKENKISELSKNYLELNKENSNLKNELIRLKDIDKENQKLKNDIKVANGLFKKEIKQKEEIIIKLNKSIKLNEEGNKNINNENLSLKEKNDEFKNSLIEKNKIIQEMNSQIANYKNQINDMNIKLKNINDESRLVMEITSLKKINANLNKQLNEIKKKSNTNSDININLNQEKDSDINIIKENYQKISEENKIIKKEKESLLKENNKKEEEIHKLKEMIDELNKKISSYSLSNSEPSSSSNSFGIEVINYDSKNINNFNIEDFRKQNDKLIELKEAFNKYKNDKKIEISIYKNEFGDLKKENEELKVKLNENNIKIYSSEEYNILCDKNYKNLQWFLLIQKTNEFSNTYENLIWVPRKKILNIEKFNDFESENDTRNKLLLDNYSKLEQKEEIISKLKYKIDCYEKIINNNSKDQQNNNIDINNIEIEKMNNILNQLNNTEEKLKILQKENIQLKEELSKINKSIKKSKSKKTSDSYKLGYDKNYEIVIDNNDNNNIKEVEKEENNEEDENYEEEEEEEDDDESESIINDLRNELEKTKIDLDTAVNEYKNLENKFNELKENFSNLLIKMKIPKKYKDETAKILKLLEFTDHEIIFIIDKMKLY